MLHHTSLNKLQYIGLDQFLFLLVGGIKLFLIQHLHQTIAFFSYIRDFADEKLSNFLKAVANVEIEVRKQSSK